MRKRAFSLIPVAALFLSLATSAADPLHFEGRFEFRTDAESLDVVGRQVCFFPDQNTARIAPRGADDRRMVWFCFKNTDAAFAALKIPRATKDGCGFQGAAAVEVVGYVADRQEGDGNDTAELVRASKVSDLAPIACNAGHG
ncbi:hypothetical protein [Lysobacter niastensis]|uniref:Secreted protein n=1 Tax=Lysobacter niastensis TaxID=380629 RepID=A0ABS0B6V1_9GAMM|nr:hypothetical protein [Lysobacter niastensis]MBF6023973.1 hypothetical protein [Lysobacter niastensis]